MIVEIARSWIGTPFLHQGRRKGQGVDCAGLIVGIAHELGLSDYDKIDYGREPANGMLQKVLNEQCEKITDYEDGCILLMRFIREPQHLAIYTKDNTVIHAYQSVGKCVEHTLDDKWKKRIVAKYRYK